MGNKSPEIKEFIANIQLWRGLPEEQLDAIVKIAIAKTYTKGEIIFHGCLLFVVSFWLFVVCTVFK